MKLFNIMVFMVFFILTSDAMSNSMPNRMFGYWENKHYALLIDRTHSLSSIGRIVLYTTGFSVAEDKWYNGEIYYSIKAQAYCADLYYGNTTFDTVLFPTPSLGTLCFDLDEENSNILLVGYSVSIKNFGTCLFKSFQFSNTPSCSGTLDFY